MSDPCFPEPPSATRPARSPAARTPRRVDQLTAAVRAVRAAGLGDLLHPVSTPTISGDRILPVVPVLRPLLPGGGLRRGATIRAVPTASLATSLLLSLLVEASVSGSWCAVVGVPTLNMIAAQEQGVVLDRLALVPDPGSDWARVVAVLLDGLDLVIAAVPEPVPSAAAGRIAARARRRGSVFVPCGTWPNPDLSLESVHSVWYGLGQGQGRLRWRQVTIRAWGKGAASLPRQVSVWLPGRGS